MHSAPIRRAKRQSLRIPVRIETRETAEHVRSKSQRPVAFFALGAGIRTEYNPDIGQILYLSMPLPPIDVGMWRFAELSDPKARVRPRYSVPINFGSRQWVGIIGALPTNEP